MDSSIVQVRSAFLIVLFRTFERLLKQWTNTSANYRRQTAQRYISRQHIAVDRDGLHFLKDAVDLAKHGSRPQADRVRAVAPELFEIFHRMRYAGEGAS
ncbi:MAG: hypothetical protein ACTHLT_07375 [Devosia sp.]